LRRKLWGLESLALVPWRASLPAPHEATPAGRVRRCAASREPPTGQGADRGGHAAHPAPASSAPVVPHPGVNLRPL